MFYSPHQPVKGLRAETPATRLDLTVNFGWPLGWTHFCISSRRWANWPWSASFIIPRRLSASRI